MENSKQPIKLMDGLGRKSEYLTKTYQIEKSVTERLDKLFDDNDVYRIKIVISSLLDQALKEMGY